MKSIIRNTVLVLVLSLVSIAAFAQPVNINKANAMEIAQELVGIGQSKAEAIVAFRDEHGAFKTADDLGLVKGIGEKTVEKNRDNILLKDDAND
jgi:competence protein ComEA